MCVDAQRTEACPVTLLRSYGKVKMGLNTPVTYASHNGIGWLRTLFKHTAVFHGAIESYHDGIYDVPYACWVVCSLLVAAAAAPPMLKADGGGGADADSKSLVSVLSS